MKIQTKEPELYYGPSAEKFYITEEDINQHAVKVFAEEDWLKSEHVAYLCEMWSLTTGASPDDYFGDITAPKIFLFAPYKATGEEIYDNAETLYNIFVQHAAPGEKTKIKGFGNAIAAAKIMLDNNIAKPKHLEAKDMRLQCEVMLHFSGGHPHVESIYDDEPWEWYLSYNIFSKELSWLYPMKDTPQLWDKHVPFGYINSYPTAGIWKDEQIESNHASTQIDAQETEELAVDIVNSY